MDRSEKNEIGKNKKNGKMFRIRLSKNNLQLIKTYICLNKGDYFQVYTYYLNTIKIVKFCNICWACQLNGDNGKWSITACVIWDIIANNVVGQSPTFKPYNCMF